MTRNLFATPNVLGAGEREGKRLHGVLWCEASPGIW